MRVMWGSRTGRACHQGGQATLEGTSKRRDQFWEFPGADFKAVVRPNFDPLYSIA